MATVAAIFDDSVALEKAVNALTDAGLGDDIVDISENQHADTPPEQSETPGATDEVGFMPAAGAGLVGSGAAGAAPIAGIGIFGGNDDPTGGHLDKLGDDAEPFRLAAQHGGKLMILETDDVAKAVSTLQSAGAQELYDPR